MKKLSTFFKKTEKGGYKWLWRFSSHPHSQELHTAFTEMENEFNRLERMIENREQRIANLQERLGVGNGF